MTTQYDKSEYYGKLSGKITTDDWDILVSYTREKLNHLLDKTWGSKPLLQNVKFTSKPYIPGVDLTEDYTFALASPVLNFGYLDGNPRAFLKMGFSGSVTSTVKPNPPVTTPIPADVYFLQIGVPLASFSAEEDKFYQGKDVVEFKPSQEAEHHIVFHFHNEDATTWDFTADTSKPHPLLENLLKAKGDIATWFGSQSHVAWVDYAVNKISSKKDPTSVLLRPKSYKFVIAEETLCVFIQTEGSGNPQGNTQDTRFGRKYDHFDFSPIPKEYTGTIIVSRDVFFRKFIWKQIESVLPGGVIEKTAEAGAKLELRPTGLLNSGGSAWIGQWFCTLESSKIDCTDHPLIIEFFDESPFDKPKYKWSWTFSGKFPFIENDKTIHITLSCEIPTKTKTLATVEGDTMKFTLAFESADQPPTKSDIDISPIKAEINLPTFTVDLPELNFFSTQNIFAPGERFIQVSDLMFPSDLVLCGNMPS
ncbi:hypothetical protein H112_05992 [Trichophyton rubrum D6]|uniref:Uncharacterized protein n=4 Tax=Trichophyton TaxID=5550 RepID=A0A178ERX3_TRIRU|nr:uncharacterized protein TERG_03699 [Trichophyton rubrum CBS 118892]EZF14821.1 hypothetical protein H100_06006 [Trichophyton rubrum MR850]EZF39938.1 hypothetical protein H102_05975 [Trichophyton rubrum CBS 100081]EZF50578.1 hypothetical protein H103_06000 [Trichophyton rubrum CBS 288.86]EZF61122.1 hypothetical protein H104_05988 [Trichophyton rubrum CBS 289.86]EZF82338.1 hypothetical protein H110_05996 [Trichophyton rubrum MR1448]EZF93014.1 hypothetical protein H113_06043 [Trichophyton rubr